MKLKETIIIFIYDLKFEFLVFSLSYYYINL